MSRKKEREPQWYMSSTKIPVLNYNEYYMKKMEWVLYAIAFFVLGAIIGYIFYGGIGINIHGEPTRITYIINTSVMVVFGGISFKILMPMRRKQLKTNRKRKIRKQFVDMLESLSISIAAGQNVPNAMQTVSLPALSRRWKTVAARAAPSLTWCSMRIRVPSFRQTAPSAPMAHCSPL